MTVTVTPTVDAGNSPPRVRLDITATSETSTTVTRLGADGTTAPVRTADGNPLVISGGAGLLYDYEMAYETTVTYSSLESPGAVSAAVSVPASQVWLVHVGIPALSMPVVFRPGTLQQEDYAVAASTYKVMGRANLVTVTDGVREGAASQVVLSTQSLTEYASVLNLLSDAGVLLLNIPSSLGIGFGTCYISVGAVKGSRLTDTVIDGYRDVTLPFTVSDRPVGGSQAQRTLADLITFSSLAALQPAYPSLLALAAGH